MCGIVGFIDFKHSTSIEVLNNMVTTVTYRGPDDSGTFYEEADYAQVGLGHTRLSIIDLSPLGHQPMKVDDLVITFNGEIYNFQQIKDVLILQGISFKSNSDTEVILRSFQTWGIKCVEKFRGMFSFIIYNRIEQKVWVVRDRVGVKPMYFYHCDDLLLFASELKSLHAHPRFNKLLDFGSLALYLQYSYIPAPHCIFQSTQKLLPGNYLEISLKDKSIDIHEYWSVVSCYNAEKLIISDSEAIEEMERILLESFNLRMVSDVPVGMFLSGGYDSTAVTALLQRNRTDRIKTFTIGFDVNGFDEAPEAKRIANYLGTDHTEYYCSPEDALKIIPNLPEIYDEPFADNSVVPSVLVSQLARKSVTVALSGDGGDEIFAGYDKFNRSLSFSKSRPLTRTLSKLMANVNPENLPWLRNSFNFSTRYEKLRLIFDSKDPAEVLKIISQHIPYTEVKRLLKDEYSDYKTYFDLSGIADKDPLAKLLAIDYLTFLNDNNLTKMDRATMSVSLEGREPFLDQNIIEFAARLPSDLKIRNGVNKYILKEIVHKHVPARMMNRPKKPFLAPLSVWFVSQLKDFFINYLSKDRLSKEGIFNVDPILLMRDQYLAGKPIKHQKLWNILIFEMWYERWMK